MKQVTESPLLRFFRNADIRTAAFFSSAALLIAGLRVGSRFELWDHYVDSGFTLCPLSASSSCGAGEPIGGEVLTFALLSLGGVASLVSATLLVLRGDRQGNPR